jgi:hypothetical protein
VYLGQVVLLFADQLSGVISSRGESVHLLNDLIKFVKVLFTCVFDSLVFAESLRAISALNFVEVPAFVFIMFLLFLQNV